MSTKQSFRVCFCFRRIFKLRVLEPPRDVKNLFDQYSQNGTMSLDDLLRFLIEFQGEENATKNDAQAIFNSLKHLNIFQRRGLQLEAFFRYLMSDLNAALSPSTGVILLTFFFQKEKSECFYLLTVMALIPGASGHECSTGSLFHVHRP